MRRFIVLSDIIADEARAPLTAGMKLVITPSIRSSCRMGLFSRPMLSSKRNLRDYLRRRFTRGWRQNLRMAEEARNRNRTARVGALDQKHHLRFQWLTRKLVVVRNPLGQK